MSQPTADAPDADARPRRDQIPEGANLCDYCTGRCCRYVALPIEEPTSWSDYDDIRWYVMHEDVAVFVEAGTWYLLVHRTCTHLLPDNRCGIYDDRPRICRSYSTENCEYDDDNLYDKLFETDAQIWEYAEAMLGPEQVPRPAAQQPGRLTVLQ